MPAGRPLARDAAHVALRFGRLMLANGADTAHTQAAVTDVAARLGYRVHLFVHAESLIVGFEDDEGFRTRVGPAVGGLAVNMAVLDGLDELRRSLGQTSDIVELDRRLDALEHGGRLYRRWLVMAAMGFTAAALARLFGGAWPVVLVSGGVGIVTQFLRDRLGGGSVNPVAGAALAAFGGGLAGAAMMRAFPGYSPTLCLVAAGMILVPGVPLLNGVRDTLHNHVATGVTRLTLGTVTILAIALGLFLAASLAGDSLPVVGAQPLLPTWEDVAFSALAGLGYAFLFNVPGRLAWACILCGAVGHGLRTGLCHSGLELPVAALGGAFVATLLARGLADWLAVPSVTFAFPGIVAMIPGSYAFHAGIGGLVIMREGAASPAPVVAETLALVVTAILITAAIAIGLSLALAIPNPLKGEAR